MGRTRTGRRVDLGWALATFVVLLAVYLPTSTSRLVSVDAQATGIGSWRIATTGSPFMDGVDVDRIPVFSPRTWLERAENGHLVYGRAAGPTIAAVPAYWLLDRHADPRRFSNAPGGYTASVLCAGAMVFLFLSLRRRLRRPAAALATGVLGLTTPVWSVGADSLWTHGITMVGLTGMGWASSRDRWLLAGALGGLAAWGRPHVALVVAVVGLGVTLSRREARPVVRMAAGSIAVVLLLLLWNHWLFGSWTGARVYTEQAGVLAQARTLGSSLLNQAGLWVSPTRGLLVWTPLLVPLLGCVVLDWRRLPDWSRWLLLGGFAYTVLQGQLNDFGGGDGFYGYRLTLEMLVCAAPACAFSAHRLGRWPGLVGLLVGFQLALISIGDADPAASMITQQTRWGDNSGWYLVRQHPVLVVWFVLLMTLGALAGRWWQRRGAAAPQRSRYVASDAAT